MRLEIQVPSPRNEHCFRQEAYGYLPVVNCKDSENMLQRKRIYRREETEVRRWVRSNNLRLLARLSCMPPAETARVHRREPIRQ